jgi:hypothetical protein
MPNARTHIVLVPGFVGFDGLGQLPYYAGTTDIFRSWKARAQTPRAAGAVLHYFDNFPTASVATRAYRLREFLTKLIARGTIADQDHISLVGHSTGGLDIRRLLADVAEQPGGAPVLDGPRLAATPAGDVPSTPAVDIPPGAILSPARELKVAFLSVPHHGTNSASFIEQGHYREAIRSAITVARIALEANRGSLPELVAPFLTRNPLNSEIALAVLDALRESDLRAGSERERAYEREAHADLMLWLGHMEGDFAAIDDLRAGAPAGSESPAHHDAAGRRAEIARYDRLGIRTRSYATRTAAPPTVLSPSQIMGTLSGQLARASLRASVNVAAASVVRAPEVLRAGVTVLGNAIKAAPGLAQQLWAALPMVPGAVRYGPGNVITALRTALGHGAGNEACDLVFAIAYSMCAYQAFPVPPGHDRLALPRFEGDGPRDIGPTDNDGIVNTLSMTFHDPQDHSDNHQITLVDQCDHADIIGHYALQPIPLPSGHGRQHARYDFFKSGSAFDAQRFERIWDDVFSFCA